MLLAVGRKFAEELDPGMGGEAASVAAGGGGGPQVARVGEDHLVAGEVGESQQLGGRQRAGRGRESEGQEGRQGDPGRSPAAGPKGFCAAS